MERFAAGAMEIGTEPVPPVPPDLDLDLDLEIDFDSLPEIELPGEAPSLPPPKPKPPAQIAPVVHAADEAPRRGFSWWPLLGGMLALLIVALAAVPFAILRLNDMTRDMALLANRVEQAESENARLTETLAREAVDAVSTHLAETERRIERIRGALDEVKRGSRAPSVASVPNEEPKPAPVPGPDRDGAKPAGETRVARPDLPTPVDRQPEPVRPITKAPLLPTPPGLEEPKGGPIVGVSKKDRAEPIAPASSVRAATAPPTPVAKGESKPAQPAPVAKDDPKSTGRILLPTELYDENEGED